MAGTKAYHVDSTNFSMRVRQLKDFLGLEMAAQILPYEAKAFTTGIIRMTPPLGKGGRLSAGKRAVKRDISATMKPMSWRVFTQNERLRKTMKALEQKQDISAIAAVLKNLKSGVIGSPDVAAFSPAFHTRRRNSYGHVSGKAWPIVVFGVQNQKALKDYIKQVQGSVGWTLSGWRSAAEATGVPLPAFAKQPAPSGYIQILDGVSPSITISNGSNKSPALKNQVRYVLKGRERALATKVSRLINKKATNIGFATVLGST